MADSGETLEDKMARTIEDMRELVRAAVEGTHRTSTAAIEHMERLVEKSLKDREYASDSEIRNMRRLVKEAVNGAKNASTSSKEASDALLEFLEKNKYGHSFGESPTTSPLLIDQIKGLREDHQEARRQDEADSRKATIRNKHIGFYDSVKKIWAAEQERVNALIKNSGQALHNLATGSEIGLLLAIFITPFHLFRRRRGLEKTLYGHLEELHPKLLEKYPEHHSKADLPPRNGRQNTKHTARQVQQGRATLDI
jgi:hypothetical protein